MRPAEAEVRHQRDLWDTLIEPRLKRAQASEARRRVFEREPISLQHCPDLEGPVTVFALGSSTMASLLGPALERMLGDAPVDFHQQAKSSSGLARPDYFDWHSKIRSIVHRFEPDVFVVSLGTNDFQPLRLRDRRWIRFESKYWAKVYARRVDRMLAAMSGRLRKRTVIWVGPTAFAAENAVRYGPVVNRIIRERIQAFDGPAYFIDAYAATTDGKGLPLREFLHPAPAARKVLRGHDGIHLRAEAVRTLLARPVVNQILACMGGWEDV